MPGPANEYHVRIPSQYLLSIDGSQPLTSAFGRVLSIGCLQPVVAKEGGIPRHSGGAIAVVEDDKRTLAFRLTDLGASLLGVVDKLAAIGNLFIHLAGLLEYLLQQPQPVGVDSRPYL